MMINPIMNSEKRSPMILTEIKQAKILKQIIMTPHPYPPTFLPCYPILNPPEKQSYKLKVQCDIGHWNLKEKVKMLEILHLSWATIPGMYR